MNFISWLLSPIALKTEAQVRTDFRVKEDRTGPWRCCLCDLMQPNGAPMVMVSSSARYFTRQETYQSLVNGGKGSHRSGACMNCVRKYK